jgi:hypothetical protein
MFKKVLMGMLLGCFMLSISWAEEKVVLAKRNGVKVYKNKKSKMNEKPVAKASKNDYLKVIKEDKGAKKYQVATAGGVIGWVNISDTKTASGTQAKYSFDDLEIQGWLDNPQAIYILDQDESDLGGFRLDKSFAGMMEENLDREKTEAEHHVGYK